MANYATWATIEEIKALRAKIEKEEEIWVGGEGMPITPFEDGQEEMCACDYCEYYDKCHYCLTETQEKCPWRQ